MASIVEWGYHAALHRWTPLHQLPFLRDACRRHGEHHSVFAGRAFHAESAEARRHISLRWYEGLLIVLLAGGPFYLAARGIGASWASVAAFASVLYGYYWAFEYVHWCEHVQAGRWLEQTRFFNRRKQRHRLHHNSQEGNYGNFGGAWLDRLTKFELDPAALRRMG